MRTPVSPVLGLIAGAGAAAALFATYWDDSWHTDRGRDEFAIPPHLILYSGVLIASLCIAWWGVLAWRAAGWGFTGVRHVLRDPALLLAGIGGMTTLASAPIDSFWHGAYGRDAVLWSPPHLAAVVGALALSVGLLAGLRATTGRGAATARLLAAAGVIGALQIPVLEYDSDVPQFSTVWFLPVAALGLCFAAAVLDDLLPGQWRPTQAALVYTALRAAGVGLLALLGFSLTAIPPIVPLLLVAGAAAAWPLAARLVLLGALSPLAWWPALQAQAEVATTVPAGQLPSAVLLGAAAGALVALAHGDVRFTRTATVLGQATVAVALLVTVIGATPQRASAHDPGQGQEVVQGLLSVQRTGKQATLRFAVPRACEVLKPRRTIARRAGQTRTGTLTATSQAGSACTLAGTVDGLGPGRWFVYAETQASNGRRLEAWLPVEPETTESALRSLYEPPGEATDSSRNAAGAGLLLIVIGLLVACLRLAGAAATFTPGKVR